MGAIQSALITAWAALLTGPSGTREWRARRVEAAHPLDVFAVVREEGGDYGILFECPVSATAPWRLRFESEGMRLSDTREAQNGTRRIALALERADLESIFLIVAEDLIASSAAAASSDEAVEAVGVRLSAWQTCLRLRREGFGRERMLGLYGELVFLERLAVIVGLDRAIEIWRGPERGLHDFEEKQFAIEIKTSVGRHGNVRIGSLEQLDPSALRVLVLCRVVVVPDEAGLALASLVERIRKSADQTGRGIRSDLDRRLLMSGYLDSDTGPTKEDRFSLTGLEAYAVRDEFPRLTRETVGVAVVAAEYGLDLAGAQHYRVTDAALDEVLGRFKAGG